MIDFATSSTNFFYRQLNFPSEPGVASEILENEAKSCLAVAQFYSQFYTIQQKLAVAKELLNYWPKYQAEGLATD